MPNSNSMEKIALVGNPNAGKTTLFNALTGSNQKIGNYAGVTVDKISGEFFTPHGHKIELVDLPGCYSLTPNSPDEQVTRDVLLGNIKGETPPSLVLCVLDATHLERHLLLLMQTIDLGYPVVAVLNKIDIAEARGLRINPDLLSETFGVPVIPICATTKKGLTPLRQGLRFPFPTPRDRLWRASSQVEDSLKQLEDLITKLEIPNAKGHAIQLLTDPNYRNQATAALPAEARDGALTLLATTEAQGHPAEAEISKIRQDFIKQSTDAALTRPDDDDRNLTDRIDSVVLHWLFGWVVLFVMMLVVFWSIFNFAEIPMDFIEGTLISGLGDFVGSKLPPGDFRGLIVDGIIGGVGSVIVFLPQIVLLFFFIGLLETSGYMARAAFMMDKVMHYVGLSGKSFLPLLSGYACAIPGIMATRTIPNAKERLATIMILPWTSCSARLPVYFLLVPLLVVGAKAQTLTLFAIYALGTVTALLAAKILRPRLGPVDPPQFLLELPPYQRPSIRYILHHVVDRAMAFLKKAGTIILGISILLWFLDTYPKSNSDDPAVVQANTFMGRAGKVIEPVVRPLGWDAKTGTAMLTSFAAREVLVSSLAISYGVDEENDDSAELHLRERIDAAKNPDGSKLFTPLSIISLLVFYVYALQCLPTTAVVRRETNSWKWAIGQLFGMTLFAYLAALIAYQVGRLLGYQ